MNRLFSSIWRKKVWRINRSANRLLIVSTNLDGFSLVNHGQFAKLSCYTVPVLGQMDVLVKYNHQEENLPLLVVKGVVAAYSEEIGYLVFH